MGKIAFWTVLISLYCSIGCLSRIGDAPKSKPPKKQDAPFVSVNKQWVDSVLSRLSPEEKIGQLLMIQATSENISDTQRVSQLIRKFHLGGVMFHNGGPVRQVNMTNYFQSVSKIPLFIAQDAEWGPSMRLDSMITFPRQMMLGAIQDEGLIYDLGLEIGRQCKRLGINFNLAPVADINNNPSNPVINSRSFGEGRINVARKTYALMAGIQHHQVLATAKHFPGHGDTHLDSHYSLPVIDKSYEQLDSLELYPFKTLIERGVGAVMTGHLHVPAIDTTSKIPASLSRRMINGVLTDSMNFKGLIITDALNMEGVAGADIAVRALEAGNDILLMPENVEQAFREIKEALAGGRITLQEIDNKCRKILKAKKWAGLYSYQPVDTTGAHVGSLNDSPALYSCQPIDTTDLISDLNSPQADILRRKLTEKSITIIKNEDNILPFKDLDKWNIASISIGSKDLNEFQKYLEFYDDISYFAIRNNSSPTIFKAMIDVLAKYDAVIVSIHNTNQSPYRDYGVTKQTIDFVNTLTRKTYVILSMFGNPYSLSRFKNLKKTKAIVVSYTDNQITRSQTAQALYGGISAEGKLPVSVTEHFPERTGLSTQRKRLQYITPKEIGIDEKRLNAIDSIIEDAIMQEAIPGCQVFAAVDGKVFFYKAYGYHTYDSLRPVKRTDIYDVASITKIAATTASLMKLKDLGKFNVNEELATYIPALDTTDKKHIIARDALAHYARIPGWLPFYASTLDDYGNLDNTIYSKTLHGVFNTEIAKDIYIRSDYRDSIRLKIYSEELKKRRRYKYSDLAFYLFQEIVEKQTNQSIDIFTAEQFYRPLGASTLGYKPLARFDKQRIVPTEDDMVYRKQLIHGYVHDAGAAMLGGVAGHAGLFTNANDLGIMMQMFLQNGEYGGVQYISPETVELFRERPYRARKNRRALGFDRPLAKYNERAHTCAEVSDESFGHTGFTGTIAWVDPKYNINFVLLSNRVYPKMENMKFVRMNVRPKVQQVIYDAVLNSPYIKKEELADQSSFFHSLIDKDE